MRKRKLQILALILAAAVLLTGCGSLLEQVYQQMGYSDWEVVPFSQMEYVRPDMTEHDAVLAESCRLAAEAGDVETVVDGIYAYYEIYDRFYTAYSLADIHYCADLTDLYWSQEYEYCAGCTAQLDAGLEELYRALAVSPWVEELEGEEYFGQDYFDSYRGDSVWDEEFTALIEQEAQLESRYYDLSNQAMEAEYYSEEYFSVYGAPMEALFVELVALRQQIARQAGYDSYPEFAYEMYHYRDFTPEQAWEYFIRVGQTLTPLYRSVMERTAASGDGYAYCSELETFRYVQNTAKAMGGSVWDAFCLLEEGELYDITYSQNKYAASFETYLESYYEPFIFLNPYLDQTDKLSFAHEFGHFCNDYVCWGSYAGTDVLEVHSQAMEYLSLCYGEADEQLVKLKLEDCLSTYVEQAAYALFEQEVYALEGDALTVENVRAINERIGTKFGMDVWGFDSRDYVTIPHYFTQPMYIASYVVSNDVALQIYQLEKEEAGAGLEVYEKCLESVDSYIIGFAESYGLESPFEDDRLEKVKKTLEEGLK